MVLADLLGDPLERRALPEGVLDLQAFEVGEVLVLHRCVSFRLRHAGMQWLNAGSLRRAKFGRLNAPPLPSGRGEKTIIERQTERAPGAWQTKRTPFP